MTARNIPLVLLLCVFALTAGCGTAAPPPSATAAPAPVSTPEPSHAPPPTPTPDPIAERLAAMTAEEKVGQLLIVGFEGVEAGADVAAYVQEAKVGGVILFKRNVADAGQLAALTNRIRELNGDGIPLFLSVDQEGGLVDRMPPEVRRMPSAYDGAKAGLPPGEWGSVLAAQCAAFGFNVDFAPSLDIWSNPDNTVIGRRSFGTAADTVAGLGPAVAQGIAAGGVIPVLKHFPGHGDTDVDSHAGLPAVGKGLDELEELELVPFRAALEQGMPAVMVAHILMTQLDPDRPASLSPAVVTGLLRGELGFDGVVFTDDLTMGAVTQNYGLGEACCLAVEAGCDQLLVCHGQANVETAHAALLSAVESGRIPASRLDESVYRILSLKAAYGLDNEPVDPPDVPALNKEIDALLAR